MDEFESTETNEPNLHLARPADAVDVRRSVTQRRISGGCSRVTWQTHQRPGIVTAALSYSTGHRLKPQARPERAVARLLVRLCRGHGPPRSV